MNTAGKNQEGARIGQLTLCRQVAGGLGIATGLLGLAGWLQPILGAAGLFFAALALFFSGRRIVALPAALLVLALAVKSLHSTPASALNVAFIGIALMLLNFDRFAPAGQFFGVTAAFAGFLPVLGHVFKSRTLYGFDGASPQSLPFALATMALGVGTACLRTDRGIAGAFASSAPGGKVARRLLLLPFALPLGIAVLIRLLQFSFPGKIHINFNPTFSNLVLLLIGVLFFAGPVLWATRVFYRAENEALIESEERYRRLFESNPHPMWLFDPYTMRFLAVNETAIEKYGYSRAEFLAITVLDITLPDNRHRTKGGGVIDVEVASHQMTFRGKPARLVFVNDITERKRIESQLRRAQRMESIGALAGGIAHDLNNVLAPILMAVQMLKDTPENAANLPYIEVLEKSAERGAGIVRQVLTFARGMEGERTTVQLRQSIDGIKRIIAETFPRSIHIEVDTPAGLWPAIADPTQVDQILLNLCVNARDAMPGGGVLRIACSNIILERKDVPPDFDATPGPYVMIEIVDTGSGIPADVINKIFEPFFTTKEFGRGTGLGLSSVHSIAKSHGGFVMARSEYGKGTSFRVFLPALESAPVEVQSEIPELCIGNGELILVVDDEAAICDITRITLESYNYRVITAGDGEEALELYAQNRHNVQVIVLDMMMPVRDGDSTIKAIKRLNADVKIIAVSGLMTGAAPAENVSATLSKPYTATELLKTLHTVLSEYSVMVP